MCATTHTSEFLFYFFVLVKQTFFIYLLLVCGSGATVVMMCLWRSKDNFWKLVVFPSWVGSGIEPRSSASALSRFLAHSFHRMLSVFCLIFSKWSLLVQAPKTVSVFRSSAVQCRAGVLILSLGRSPVPRLWACAWLRVEVSNCSVLCPLGHIPDLCSFSLCWLLLLELLLIFL